MSASQIKLMIFLIRSADWVLVAGLVAYLIYAYLSEHSANFIITVGLIGVIIIHQIGQWTITKVAYLRQTLKRLETPTHIR